MGYAEVGSGSQRASGTADGSTSLGVATPANVTSGNLLVAIGSWSDSAAGGSASHTVTSTRTSGNWTSYKFKLGANPGYLFIAFAVATSSGTCTITSNGFSSGDYHAFAVDEFSGQHATPFSVDGGGSSGTGTSASDSLTTITDNELILACTGHFESAAPTMTEGGSFTKIGEEENGTIHMVYNGAFRIVTTQTSYTASWTYGSSTPWYAMTISLKEATGGAIFVSNLMLMGVGK